MAASTEIGQFFDIVPFLASDHYFVKWWKSIRGNTDLSWDITKPFERIHLTVHILISLVNSMKNLLVQCPSVSVKTKNVGSIRDFLSAEFLLDFPMGVRVGVDNLPEGNITIDKKQL